MNENASPLHSAYIIDGELQTLTPAQILGSVSAYPDAGYVETDRYATIVDETPEAGSVQDAPDPRRVERYLGAVLRAERSFPMPFAGPFTRGKVAQALLDCLWRLGHFRIGNLCVDASWRWNDSSIGNMAGFFRSVEALGDHLSMLNLQLREYSFSATERRCSLEMSAGLRPGGDEDEIVEQPFTTSNAHMGAASISGTLCEDPQSWIIYIPFDSSPYRLGGSLLSQALDLDPPTAPALDDADYFLDCFEVVRELVEDGIVMAGATVGEGGLLAALKGMTGAKMGASADISDIRRAYPGTDIVSILFAEIPGAVIQIRDIDFDYVDAELLLQDVAFYPLGHPVANGGAVRVRSSAKTGLQNILESLVQRQGGEGED